MSVAPVTKLSSLSLLSFFILNVKEVRNSAFVSLGGTTWTGDLKCRAAKNWILPKEIIANRFFWDSHWLEIRENHLCPSMGPNGGSVALDSDVACSGMAEGNKPVLFYFYSFHGTASLACLLLFSVVNCQRTYEPLCFFIMCFLNHCSFP